VRIADVNLVVDAEGLYVPAKAKDVPLVSVGEVYVTSPKGDRKASGSHYTPTFIVRRLLENALQPVLERHLTKFQTWLLNSSGTQCCRSMWLTPRWAQVTS